MKILVLGHGFVGAPLAIFLEADLSVKRLHKITAEDLLPYDVVINTAAKTSIDWCEKNRLETFDTNITQAVRIATLLKPEAQYVFFSSGCIFKSEGPTDINYEDAQPNPQCFYTYTKLMAEQLLAEVRPNTLIIRPRLLISAFSHPRNTINKLLSYDKIVASQESATVLEDLMPKLKELIEAKATGAFNIFNEGLISPDSIASMFDHPHRAITKNELDKITYGKAKRVSTVLGSMRTEPLPNITDRLREIRDNWKD